MIFFKLIRLGYTINTYKSAVNGALLMELHAPDQLTNEEKNPEGDLLLVCGRVDALDFITVTLAVEETLRHYCLQNGI